VLAVRLPLLILLAQAQPNPALNDSQAKASAQTLLAEGNALYDEGKSAAALEKFEAAHRIFPSPKIYLNIGQASLDLGRALDALRAFEKFLATPSGAPPEAVEEARRSLREVQKTLGRLKVETAIPGFEVVVDGKLEGTTPLPGPIWVTPGTHLVKFDHVDYLPMGRQVDVKVGAMEMVALRPQDLPALMPPVALAPSLETAAVSPPRLDGRGGITGKRWFWPALGVAAVVGVLGVYAASSGRTNRTPETSLGAQQVFQ
jgi:tetratricopeptide (TPR) repeat protein